MKKDIITEHERLGAYFRRFGLEGQSAFHALAGHYLAIYGGRLETIPQSTANLWVSSHTAIEGERAVEEFLDGCVLSDPTGERLPDWYQFFIGRRFREGSGKFFTPKPIASVMAGLLPDWDHPIIMDPTCGGATFLVEVSRRWHQKTCILIANDVEPTLYELAMLHLDLATPKGHAKHFSCHNIFDSRDGISAWFNQVDGILANPPFSLRIPDEQFNSPLFTSGYRNSDALFLDTSLKLLRPGGRLVCLLPHSLIANNEYSNLRSVVENSWTLLGVISLPEGVFHLSAGTTTRADIVILEKKGPNSRKDRPVAFASVPSVGIRLNNKSREVIPNDLDTIVQNLAFRNALGI